MKITKENFNNLVSWLSELESSIVEIVILSIFSLPLPLIKKKEITKRRSPYTIPNCLSDSFFFLWIKNMLWLKDNYWDLINLRRS